MSGKRPDMSWDAPVPGAFTRSYRFGEWIADPVTPLFESWLLTAMEDRLHEIIRESIGQAAPRPYHVVVNGWYFYSMNWASPRAMLGNLPRMFAKAVRHPRHVAGILPATVRHSVDASERIWREDVQPRYRKAVAAAEASVDSRPVGELAPLIDELAGLAGEYFASIAALSGAAYKLELNLAAFHRTHLQDSVGWSHLPLVSGFAPPDAPDRPAVVSLDWLLEPVPASAAARTRRRIDPGVIERRRAAEAASTEALSSSPRRLGPFRRLLADAQRLISIREEQTQELTLAWPVLRRAVLRLGEALVTGGRLAKADDVFFLTRDEAMASLAGGSMPGVDVDARRQAHAARARLIPPLVVGTVPRMAARMLASFTTLAGARPSPRALVAGTPASAGRATGHVRVIRGAAEFDELLPGEILVAPITAPAWTPLFTQAAGVVTDVGSVAAHASVIAREFGIPAIVGTGDATRRLHTGMLVTIDGGTGTVEAAQDPSTGTGLASAWRPPHA